MDYFQYDPSVVNLPHLTAALPGIGGVLKHVPEDFAVEEIRAYLPCGDGEHLFLWIEKRDVSAEDLTVHLARALGVRRDDIGVAGLKDRRAVTRQFVSVPAAAEPRIAAIETEQIRVLHATRHRNKLRSGHLRGNRFEILVRDVVPDAPTRAAAIARVIGAQGGPNYFGEQRFGHDGETSTLGFDLLAGRKRPSDIDHRRRKFLLKLSLSAAQSAMFNTVLSERISDGILATVLSGDVMQVVASGGCFVVEDVDREQPRYDAHETVLTGPLFGPSMKHPGGVPAEREQRVLERFGVTAEQLTEYDRFTAGARRPLIIWPGDLQIEPDPAGLRFRFTLPGGCYATTLLREFMKNGSDPAAGCR